MLKKRILWADDEIELLQSHILYLQTRGYEVETVTNGDDAIGKFAEGNFDIVLLDEMMTGKDGLATLQEIKNISPQIPVIMITKNEDERLMEDAIGRPLARHEHVHHIDGNKLNNALSNLQLLRHGEHTRITNARKPPILFCWQCGLPFPSAGRAGFHVGDSVDHVRVFCSRRCQIIWNNRTRGARRNHLPPPAKAPICPLEDLLFPT